MLITRRTRSSTPFNQTFSPFCTSSLNFHLFKLYPALITVVLGYPRFFLLSWNFHQCLSTDHNKQILIQKKTIRFGHEETVSVWMRPRHFFLQGCSRIGQVVVCIHMIAHIDGCIIYSTT